MRTDRISESLWINQLQKEFANICWQYRVKLSTPSIEIIEASSYWGQWDSFYRRIRISKNLVLNQSWNVVINILKHEMAHQIVSEIFKNEAEGHGPLFLRACDMLGVEAAFRKSGADLPHEIPNWRDAEKDGGSDSDELRLIGKVKKLMALAQSSNEHEAMVCMQKVYEIYEKYNLEKIESLKADKEFVYAVIDLKSSRVEAFQSHISCILEEFYFVKVILSSVYDPHANKTNRTLEIFGTQENVQMAEYVYYFLENQVMNMWRSYATQKKLSVKYKRSYLVGLLSGFREKLKSIQQQSQQKFESPDLKNSRLRDLKLITENPALKDFISKRFPRISQRGTGRSGVYGDVFQTGKSDGSKIVIHRGIEGTSRGDGFIKSIISPIKSN